MAALTCRVLVGHHRLMYSRLRTAAPETAMSIPTQRVTPRLQTTWQARCSTTALSELEDLAALSQARHRMKSNHDQASFGRGLSNHSRSKFCMIGFAIVSNTGGTSTWHMSPSLFPNKVATLAQVSPVCHFLTILSYFLGIHRKPSNLECPSAFLIDHTH